jgi:hypothetical protein
MTKLMNAGEARKRGAAAQAAIEARAAELLRQAEIDDARRQADGRSEVEILTEELLAVAAETIANQVSYNSHRADIDSRYGEIEGLVNGHPKDDAALDDRWLAWDRVEAALVAKGYETRRNVGLLPYPGNSRVVVTLQAEW